MSHGKEQRQVIVTDSSFTFYWIQVTETVAGTKLTGFTRLLLAVVMKKQSFLHLSVVILGRNTDDHSNVSIKVMIFISD